MAYEVFISYSHQDQTLRKELDTHLANLKRQDIITSWYDGDIKPGEELQPQSIEHLNKAQIILLLVSADLIASDFCYSIDMKQPSSGMTLTKPASFPFCYVLPIGNERRSPNSRCCPPMRKRSRNGLHSTKAL